MQITLGSLDLNAPYYAVIEPSDFGTPVRELTNVSTVLSDGFYQSDDKWSAPRQIPMVVRVTGPTMDEFIDNLNALQSEVLKDTNTLTVVPEGAWGKIYFNILKSPPFSMPLTNRVERRLRADVSFILNAEPYAYGDDITICGYDLVEQKWALMNVPISEGYLPSLWGYTGTYIEPVNYYFVLEGEGEGYTSTLYYPNSSLPSDIMRVSPGVEYGVELLASVYGFRTHAPGYLPSGDYFVKVKWYNSADSLISSSTIFTFSDNFTTQLVPVGVAARVTSPLTSHHAVLEVSSVNAEDGSQLRFAGIDMGTGIYSGLSDVSTNGPVEVDLGNIEGNVEPTLDVKVGCRVHGGNPAFRSLVMFPTTGYLDEFVFEAEDLCDVGYEYDSYINFEGDASVTHASQTIGETNTVALHTNDLSWGALQIGELDKHRIYNVYAMHYVDKISINETTFLTPTKFSVASGVRNSLSTFESHIKRKVRAWVNLDEVSDDLLDTIDESCISDLLGSGTPAYVESGDAMAVLDAPVPVAHPGQEIIGRALNTHTTGMKVEFYGTDENDAAVNGGADARLTFNGTSNVSTVTKFNTISSFDFIDWDHSRNIYMGQRNTSSYADFVLQPVGTVQVGEDGILWFMAYQGQDPGFQSYDIMIDYILLAPSEYGILSFYTETQEDPYHLGIPNGERFIGPTIIELSGNKVSQKFVTEWQTGTYESGGENYTGISGGSMKAPLGTNGKLIIAHSPRSHSYSETLSYMPIEVEIKYTPRWIHWR